MDFKRLPWKDFSLFVVEFFVICNILFLDVWIFQHLQSIPKPQALTTSTIPSAKSPITGEDISSESSNMNSVITQAPTQVKTEPTIIQVIKDTQSSPIVKEYFVPLGTGTGAFNDWQNVPGTLATIDSNSYPNIKSVTFEASVHNLASDQIIFLRIFDVTDNHAIYNSDITFSQTEEQFGSSNNFALDGGAKQYQVQLKTQLQSPVSLDMARIHIILN